MAGLLAWAADVVKAHKDDDDNEDAINSSIPLVFTEEQQKYVRELDQKAASLSRSIRDLRLRLPPPDISQRLPHLHAHSLAYSAALSQQLSSHSSTREQVLLFSFLIDFLIFFILKVCVFSVLLNFVVLLSGFLISLSGEVEFWSLVLCTSSKLAFCFLKYRYVISRLFLILVLILA